jgi:hypothetical protein
MDLKSLISIEKTTKFYQLVTDSGIWLNAIIPNKSRSTASIERATLT